MLPAMEAVIIVTILVGFYLLTCLLWPFAACGAGGCQGGKIRSPGGRHWRPCGRCGGSGKRRRMGAVLLGRGKG
jgi:hypothetical protein